MSLTKIQKLEKEILKHKELYYQGEAKISDQDFDKLEEQLKKIAPESPVLNIVGAPVKSSNKIKHAKKMLSLDKCYDLEKFIKWMGNNELVSTYKIDGSSCSIVYKSGVLKFAKTRGDGSYGENILEKVLYISEVPNRIKDKKSFEVRGEIFCTDGDFLKISKQMEKEGLPKPQSKRNIVAGLLGRKENNHLSQFLRFQAFELISDDFKPESEFEKFKILKKLGFVTPDFYINKSQSDIEKRISDAESFMNDGEYLIDGLVFTINNISLHSKLGETAHHPRYKMAYKFQGDTKKTKILDIEWGVSRNGTLTPVALVEPVELSQAMVSRVTLHNYGIVLAEKLKKGDEIEIVRSGEVIPKFLRVVKASKIKQRIPDKCPSCDTKIKVDDIRLLCVNDDCPAKNLELIQYFVATIGIDDLSSKRLGEMIRVGLVFDIPSLYDLTVEDFLTLDKTKEKMANKLYENIQNSKEVGIVQFMSALGIAGGGSQKCEKIAQAGFNTVEKFINITKDELAAIEGFAEKSANDFVVSLKSKKKLVKSLLKQGFNISKLENNQASGGLSGLKFCITGTLSMKRTEIQRMIKNQGGEIVSSVSVKTSYVVTNDTKSSSSKFKKAKELNIPIINETKLLAMME